MYAIVQVGNTQFKVAEGDVINAHRFQEDAGAKVSIDKVLLFSDGKDVRIGQPFLKDVKVTAKVVDHNKADKVTALHYRRRKDSSTKRGHRQKHTSLSIEKIAA